MDIKNLEIANLNNLQLNQLKELEKNINETLGEKEIYLLAVKSKNRENF